MQLGLESFSYHLAFTMGRMDIFEFIQRAAQLGLEGIQINVVRGKNWGHLGGNDSTHLEKIRTMANDLGFFIEIDTRGTDPVHLINALDVCHALGADVLRTYVSLGGNLATELQQAKKNIRQVVSKAEDLGIRIALENHEYETSDDMVRLLERIDHPQIGLLVDIGNSMMVLEDPLSAIRNLAPYAISAHFKDHVVIENGESSRVVGVPIGMGNIDIKACFRILVARSNLTRINIEESYGYSAPFRIPPPESKDLNRLGAAFRRYPMPHDPAVIAPYLSESIPSEGAEQYLVWQDLAVQHSVAQMKRIIHLFSNKDLSPPTNK
jgi:sugar phosphate isomerase/epimerase